MSFTVILKYWKTLNFMSPYYYVLSDTVPPLYVMWWTVDCIAASMMMMRSARRLSSVLAWHMRTPRAQPTRYTSRSIIPRRSTVDSAAFKAEIPTISCSKWTPPHARMLSTSTSPTAFSEASPAVNMFQILAASIINAADKNHPANRPILTGSVRQLNDTLRDACTRRDFDMALRSFHALVSTGGPSSVETESYDILLYEWSRLCASRRGESAVDMEPMLALLQDLVPLRRASARAFKTAVVACHRLNDLASARRVVSMMQQSGRQPGEFMYTNLISCCARLATKHKRRQALFIQDAEALFEEMLRSSHTVRKMPVVNAMLFAYRAGRGYSRQAVALVERALHEWTLAPDASTINTLLLCLLKDGNSLEAARWLEIAIRRSVSVDDKLVRSVVDACRRQAQWTRVDALAELLARHGIAQHDKKLKRVLTQNRRRQDASGDGLPVVTLLPSTKSPSPPHTTVKAAKIQAKTRLKEIRNMLHRGSTTTLEAVTEEEWTHIFKYSDVETLEELMRLLWRCPSVIPDMARILELYLKALGEAHYWWRIVEVVELGRERINSGGLTAAVRACTRSGRLDEALRVVELMVDQRRIHPTRDVYDALLQCCASTGSVEQALGLYAELETRCHQVKSQDVTAVLKAFAVAVHRVLVEENASVSESDLTQLAVHALQFYDRMKSRDAGKVGEIAAFSLLQACLGHAETVDVIDVLVRDDLFLEETEEGDEEEEEGRRRPGAVVDLPRAVLRVCRDAAAEKTLSARVVNVGIDYFLRRGKPEGAFELFNTMAEAGIRPSADTVRLLFEACSFTGGDEQLGLKLMDHLIAEEERDEWTLEPAAREALATNALRWAAEMEASAGDGESKAGLLDRVMLRLKARRCGGKGAKGVDYAVGAGVFAVEGNIVQTRRMVERAMEERGVLSLSLANRVMQACSVARAPMMALETLGWMRRRGAEPDLMAYNNVLRAIVRRRTPKRSQAVGEEDEEEEQEEEEEEEEEDEEDEGATYARTRRADREHTFESNLTATVDEVLAEMVACGVMADSQTFELSICIAAEREELRRVTLLFDQALFAAAERHTPVRDLLSEKTLAMYLNACASLAEQDPDTIVERAHNLRQMLAQWHRDKSGRVASSVLVKLLQVYDALGQWQEAVSILRNAEDAFGVVPTATMIKSVMAICNQAGQYRVSEQIYLTLQRKARTNAECVVERIYAMEQLDQWTEATRAFTEMARQFPPEELRQAKVQRLALGRYAAGRTRV